MVAYDPLDTSSVFAIHDTPIERVLVSWILWGSVLFFFALSGSLEVWARMDRLSNAHTAAQLNAVLSYPTIMVGTLFSFMLGFFTTKCYGRVSGSSNPSVWRRVRSRTELAPCRVCAVAVQGVLAQRDGRLV